MQVRWGDMDAIGHVNNVEFFRYAETGRVAYFDQLFGDDLDFWGGRGPILKTIQCDYLRQVKYPADLEVATRCKRLGGKSLTMEVGIFDTSDGALVAALESTTVWFDYAQQVPVTVPDQTRATIIGFETVTPEGPALATE